MTTQQRLLSFLRPYRGRLIVAIAAMAGLALTTGSYPVLLDLLATVLIQGDEQGVAKALEPAAKFTGFIGLPFDPNSVGPWLQAHLIWVFAAVVAVKAACQAVRFYVMGSVAQHVIVDLRMGLFDSLLRQGSSFFSRRSSGELVSRVTHDVALVERATTYAIPVMLGDFLRVAVLALVCLFQYTRLFFVAALVIPLAAIPITVFGRMLRRYGKGAQEQLGGLTHRITETLGGMDVIKTYGAEAHELERFEQSNRSYLNVMLRSVMVRALQTPVMELIGVAALLGTLGYAIQEVQQGNLRPGEVVGFLLALVLLYEPAKALGRINGILMPGLAAADRVFEVIDQTPDIQDEAGAVPLDQTPSQLRFKQLSFRYEAEEPWAVRQLSFTIERGQALALVGPSGAGKSTIAALVARLYDPQEGSVSFDGHNLRTLTLECVRAQVSVVSQHSYLFNDSVAANLRYGRPGASDEELYEAAKRAQAHEFISALPGGYDHVVGERGVRLSGGQRQRLSIARALVRNAPIVVLDEPTSALDPQNEAEVQGALQELCKDRIAIVIAHDLAMVRLADEIIVMHEGTALQRGTHDQLMASSGWFSHWAKEQS